ncbi:MAG TPA: hypothetical protein VNY73_04960, partial [Bacteroidia bacterium]|nr:hypothetical protein [Bacteroidia bacterium]
MKKFFIILLLLFVVPAFPAGKKKTVQYDTITVSSVKKASSQKEKEVFSDKDFAYHEDAKESKNWLRAFIDWLMENLFGKMSVESSARAWQIIKWTFIGLFIAGVIFIILRSKFRGLFRGDSKKLSGASFTDLPEDIESVNIDKLIEEALQNGNYRLAVRWCFLKALQSLNENKLITWRPSKTNIDYGHELQNVNLRQNFDKLSYVFEHVWYG